MASDLSQRVEEETGDANLTVVRYEPPKKITGWDKVILAFMGVVAVGSITWATIHEYNYRKHRTPINNIPSESAAVDSVLERYVKLGKLEIKFGDLKRLSNGRYLIKNNGRDYLYEIDEKNKSFAVYPLMER